MKTKTIWLCAAAAMLASCTLDPVIEWGARCPPRDIEDFDSASLTYIGDESCTEDNLEACDMTNITAKSMQIFFDIKTCPEYFGACVQNDKNDPTAYHCETVSQSLCNPGKLCEKSNGSQFCLDPSKDTTCGATDCEAEAPTYNGTNCLEIQARCKHLGEGKYGCIGDENGELKCGDTLINPSDEKTCGANDCKQENYGGDDCSLHGEYAICAKDSTSDRYHCKCRKDDVLCDDMCIRPIIDDTHCGARGECNSDDESSNDYEGMNCAESNGYCRDGKCMCYGKGVWCIVKGLNDDKPQCYSPDDDETCGATLSEDGINCETQRCKNNESCRINNSAYTCELTECGEGLQLCHIQNAPGCYSLLDIQHCGNCSTNCNDTNYLYVTPVACQINKETGNPACAYACKEGLTNCGTEFAPNCVDLNSFTGHCGACGKACPPGSSCNDGHCKQTDCPDTMCSDYVNNEIQCGNTDARCGKDCINCKNIHDNAICTNGNCTMKNCEVGQHPVYNSSAEIEKCEPNTPNKCAAANIKASDTVQDCTTIYTNHVSSTDCIGDGQCVIAVCDSGYHLSADQKSCIANSASACGKNNSTSAPACAKPANAATMACVGNGQCQVTSCNTGYHLSGDKTRCIQNSGSECAKPDSSNTKSCYATNVAAAECPTGSCIVKKCFANYHITNDNQACEVNKDTACGPTDGYGASCSGITSHCIVSQGICACSADGSTVLNVEGNACVDKACKGVPGVKSGVANYKNYYSPNYHSDYTCKPTACLSGFSYDSQNIGAICRRNANNGDCGKYGFATTKSNEDTCYVTGQQGCKDGYHFYIRGCLPNDSCCGPKGYTANDAEYFQCTNCAADGKKCDRSSGTCI